MKFATIFLFLFGLVLNESVMAFDIVPQENSQPSMVGQYIIRRINVEKTGLVGLFICQKDNPASCDDRPLLNRLFTNSEIDKAMNALVITVVNNGLVLLGADAVAGCGSVLLAAWVVGTVPLLGQLSLGAGCILGSVTMMGADVLSGTTQKTLNKATSLANGASSTVPVAFKGTFGEAVNLLENALLTATKNSRPHYYPIY